MRSPDLSDLAHAASAALGAGAAVLILDQQDGRTVVGLAGTQPGDVEAILASDPEAGAPAGFAAQLVGRADLEDGGSVELRALQRTDTDFENAALAAVFASQAALALAVGPPFERAPSPLPRSAELVLRAGRSVGLDDLLEAVTDDVTAAIGPARIALHRFDDELDALHMIPGSLGVSPELTAGVLTSEQDWESSVARVFTTGRPYLTNEVVGDAGILQEYVPTLGLRRLLALRLDVAGHPVGVIQVADTPAPLTPAVLRAVEELSPGIAVALAIVSQRDRLERRGHLEQVLRSVAVDIAGGKNLQEFLGAALDAFCAAARAATIALVPVDGEPMVWRADEQRLELEHIVVAEARGASSVRAYVVSPRRAGDPGWAAVHMPVVANDTRVATLAALRHHGQPFGEDERQALSRLAALIALAGVTEEYQRRRATLARRSERQRIGDELHDHTAQLLFGARLCLDTALESGAVGAEAIESTERARSLVARADDAIRVVINDLAERGEEDLDALLAAVVAGIESEFGRPVQLEITPAAATAAGHLRRPVVDLLAKVAREALVNAAKHAGPGQLSLRVALTRRNHLLLAVSDDGMGAPVRAGHEGHGLVSLRRAVRRHGGSLRVRVASTGGRTVTVSLPL